MDAVQINTSDPSENEDIDSDVEICRVCLSENLVTRDLFLENEVTSLSAKAMSFANVKMMPGDGLPARVCCVCADKLESAYEFKLQVEQADSMLREKFDTLTIKEEMFFNEVEVRLEAERHENLAEIHVSSQFETNEDLEQQTVIHTDILDEKSSALKDKLALLEVEKFANQNQENLVEGQESIELLEQQASESLTNDNSDSTGAIEDSTVQQTISTVESEDCTNDNHLVVSTDAIPAEEHDYILHQGNIDDIEHRLLPKESISCDQQTERCTDLLESLPVENNKLNNVTIKYEEHVTEEEETVTQECQIQNEARRSKRKATRRILSNNRNSDEESYFENLNLSSRLRKVQQMDKSEKILFMCYLCDKQFLSKNVLKEHMHSHEEVRQTLSLKKTPEKLQKSGSPSSKMPPSGKKANKCPYCGKEYLYIISFNKHIKQHEREKDDPTDPSFIAHEDNSDCENVEGSQNSDEECRKRKCFRRMDDEGDGKDENEKERAKRLCKSKENSEEFACEKCLEKFPTKRALQKHSYNHVSLTCNVCGEEFNTLEKLRNHRTKHVVEGVLTEQDLEENVGNVIDRIMADNEDGDGYGDENDGCHDYGDDDRNSDDENDAVKREESDNETVPEDNDRTQKNLKCPECFMVFFNKKSLSRHMETHIGTKYICKICNQVFRRKDQLRKHDEQHGKIKSYKCTQCNKTFGNELTLRNHLIATNHKTFLHGQEYDPNKRIKRVAAKAAQKIIDKITTEDGLEDYDEVNDPDDSNDYDTNYIRKKESLSKRHSYKKELECATCNKRCNSKQSLTRHMEEHVKDEKMEKDKAKRADKRDSRLCGTGSEAAGNGHDDDDDDDDNSDFASGLDWPIDNHECPTCKKRYSTKKSLLRHQLLHEEPNFECDICNVKFYRKDKLKAHYDKCSERNPDQVRKCNICGDSFENNEMLREHRSKHVTDGILTEEDLRDIEPRPDEKKLGVKTMRRRRTDIVGLECTECNKQYTSRKGLLRHIQVHEGKKYLCDICPKKFYRREHLKIHVAKHNMIKPYKCTRCTKRFIKEEQLTNHLSKHDRSFKKNKETDTVKRFLCEICSKSFTQSTTLIAHLRAHNGIKPYVCEVCSRPFTTNAYLKMHMRTHTQERPYICQYCSRAFARADTLANHLTSHTGEAKYHCKYCPKNFRRLKSLKEHVFIHTGQRPYACPTCDRRFNNNGSRYAHSKRCKQNFLQNQNRTQTLAQTQQPPNQQRVHQTLTQTQLVKAQNIKTITIARQAEPVTAQQVMQHQEILMPLILPLTVTLTDVGEEVILPEGTKIFTTS
ncbi:zinc finger protein 814-like [Prorops nasuta]|uniref:zinc finger protein 814-like n=1 Tax=Prorops nasuta TaxID=863751 RepID=UPI0034CEA7CF